MAHETLKRSVWKANMELVAKGLVELTWGNASGIDRDAGVMAIKPSGFACDALEPNDIVVLSLDTGTPLDQRLRPSSDAPTHLYLYREFGFAGGIAHTHSPYAVSWAQAERELPCLGTTHADHFCGSIPVTRRLRDDEIADDYERNTGAIIAERFRAGSFDPASIPGILVAGHGPFTWGSTPGKAVENAVVLEAVARTALYTVLLNPSCAPIDPNLLNKHFLRKHGPNAYYGQDGETDRR